MVGSGKLAEHHPMMGPVDSNEHKTEHERHEIPPLFNQQSQQASAGIGVRRMRNADGQHQQSDCKREYPIAESTYACQVRVVVAFGNRILSHYLIIFCEAWRGAG